jgi:hypothetical protein
MQKQTDIPAANEPERRFDYDEERYKKLNECDRRHVNGVRGCLRMLEGLRAYGIEATKKVTKAF